MSLFRSVFERHPRAFLIAFGLVLANLVCKLMLAHICDVTYSWRRVALFPMLAATALALAPVAGQSSHEVLGLIFSACCSYAH